MCEYVLAVCPWQLIFFQMASHTFLDAHRLKLSTGRLQCLTVYKVSMKKIFHVKDELDNFLSSDCFSDASGYSTVYRQDIVNDQWSVLIHQQSWSQEIRISLSESVLYILVNKR